jgi:hypothetical protein
VDLNPARGYSMCDVAACHVRPIRKPNGPRLGGLVWSQRGLAGWAAQRAHAAWPRRGHRAPATRGGAAAGGSLLPAPRCGVVGEDEESSGSTPEVAMVTGTHQRRMSMMRWFDGGETSKFGHRRQRPDAQWWLAVTYRTGGRMGMRRRGGGLKVHLGP